MTKQQKIDMVKVKELLQKYRTLVFELPSDSEGNELEQDYQNIIKALYGLGKPLFTRKFLIKEGWKNNFGWTWEHLERIFKSLSIVKPWQMTLLEFAKSKVSVFYPEMAKGLKESEVFNYKGQYLKDMQGWINAGKNVPKSILNKYPCLGGDSAFKS